MLNVMQKIAQEISGYEPTGPFSSAINDYYYESENKIQFIIDFAFDVHDIELSQNRAQRIYDFLEGEFDQDDRWHAFKMLPYEKSFLPKEIYG